MPPLKNLVKRLIKPRLICHHASLLLQIPMFSTLTYRELSLVELILHERSYQADEVVFEEGEHGMGMYIILDGQVRILRRKLYREISPRDLTVLDAGDSFGELALLGADSKRTATVMTTRPTRLLTMFQPEFLHLLQIHDRLGAKLTYELARNMADKFRAAMEQNEFDQSL